MSTIRRALISNGLTYKVMRRIAQQRNADLRDYYEHLVTEYPSYYRVYVNESCCDKRIGIRRRGWSPRGVTPELTATFSCGQR